MVLCLTELEGYEKLIYLYSSSLTPVSSTLWPLSLHGPWFRVLFTIRICTVWFTGKSCAADTLLSLWDVESVTHSVSRQKASVRLSFAALISEFFMSLTALWGDINKSCFRMVGGGAALSLSLLHSALWTHSPGWRWTRVCFLPWGTHSDNGVATLSLPECRTWRRSISLPCWWILLPRGCKNLQHNLLYDSIKKKTLSFLCEVRFLM